MTAVLPGDTIDKPGLVLDAARVLFEGGDQSSRVIHISESLAETLGVPGKLHLSWGRLLLISQREPVRAVPGRPESVQIARVQHAVDAIRAFQSGASEIATLRTRIDEAGKMAPSGIAPFLIAAGAGAVALDLIWGLNSPGGLMLVALAAVVGAILRRGLALHQVGLVWQIFAAALVGGFVGGAAGVWTNWSPGELVALGPALVLVPGPELLNGGLDISGGRISLGLARLTYAVITILAISAGILIGLSAAGATLPVTAVAPPLPLWGDAVCAALASGAYAVFFSMPWRLIPIAAVAGAAAHLLHSVLVNLAGWNVAVASGVGAIAAGLALGPVSERLRVPFAGIGFAAVVAMMPSVYVHRAVSGLLLLVQSPVGSGSRLLEEVVVDGVTAGLVVLALVLGLVVPLRAYRLLDRHRR